MYDSILEAWKKEKDSEVIQPLPPQFLENALEYLSRLRLASSEKEPPNNKSTIKREVEYVEYMLTSLLKMRAKKIMLLSLEGPHDVSASLLKKEVELTIRLRENLGSYTELAKTQSSFQTDDRMVKEPTSTNPTTQGSSNLILLRVLQPLPKLVGADLDEYGPFQPEDIVFLPRENALVLISQGVASEIKPSPRR